MQHNSHAARGQHIRSLHMQHTQTTQNMAAMSLGPHQSHHMGNSLTPHGGLHYLPSPQQQQVRDQQNRLGHPPSSIHSHHTQQQRLNNSKQPPMHQISQQGQQLRQTLSLNNQQQQQQQQIQSRQRYQPPPQISSNGPNRQQQQQQQTKQHKSHPNNHVQSQSSQINLQPIAVTNISSQQANCQLNSTQSRDSVCGAAYPKVILQNTCRISKTVSVSASAISNESNSIATATKNNIVSLNQPNVQEYIVLNSRTKPLGSITTERLSTITEVPQENSKRSNDRSNSQSPNELDAADTTTNENDHQFVENVSTSTVKECQVPSTKEKTPMCLVNELARYNKILHQYRLTGEKGPAHSKRFVVKLKLGDEEYSAEGNKIKKAQHLAAAEAIEKTRYKHPVPKAVRRLDDGTPRATITPTVELNALAMKLGQQTYYLFDARSHPPDNLQYQPYPPHLRHHIIDSQGNNPYIRRNVNGFYPRDQSFIFRSYPQKLNGQHPQRIPMVPHPLQPLQPPPPPPPPPGIIMAASNFCKITLIVGRQKFIGTGRTLQAAKHDAASRALQVLKAQAANKLNEILNPSDEDHDGKSPISQVHEIALKRNFSVQFKVIREEGPAHMRNFVTECKVGSLTTEGEGNGKKISKKRAAEKMLDELKKLPPLSPTKSPVRKLRAKTQNKPQIGGEEVKQERRKRSGNTSIKERPQEDGGGDGGDNANPISKLIEITQSHKEKDPVYELVCKVSEFKRREFIMEVMARGFKASGTGANKKIAKRNAAQNLLSILEQNSARLDETNQENNSQLANQNTLTTENTATANDDDAINNENIENASKVASGAPSVKTSAGQIPGILILRQGKRVFANSIAKNNQPNEEKDATIKDTMILEKSHESSDNESGVLNNKNNNTSSTSVTGGKTKNPTTTTTTTTTKTSSSSSNLSIVRPKDQLLYLSQVLGFQVDFSDFPKGNHTEFLTIVTLSSVPPQICHGVGINREASQDDAARTALNLLSELGLDNSNSKEDN